MATATSTSDVVMYYELLSSNYLASLLVVLASVCVYLHIRAFSYWSSRGIKGPRPWPIFGTNIYYVLGNKLEVDMKWRREYGKTYGLYEGYSPLLRTTDNEVIKQIYVKRFSSFTDRHNEFIHGEVVRNWLLWSEGERWANQRALVSPMFSSSRMRNMLATMTTCVDRFLGQAKARLVEQQQQQQYSNEKSELVQLAAAAAAPTFGKRDLSNMTLDVIASSFFGLKLDVYGDWRLKGEFFAKALEVSRLDPARFLAWVLMPRQLARYLRFDLFPRSSFEYFDQLTKRIIEERRRNSPASKQAARLHQQPSSESTVEISSSISGQAASSKDFVQLFLEAKLPENEKVNEKVFGVDDDKEAHYNDDCKHEQLEQIQREQTRKARLFKNFTDLEIRGQMTFLFIAGFETTSTTIVNSIYELAHQPDVQARLFKELEATFGGHEELRAKFAPPHTTSIKGGKSATSEAAAQDLYSQLMSLTLLDSFVSESLRLYSPLLEHNRRATEPVELTITNDEGREKTLKLPRGLPISTSGFVLQREPDYFDSPNEFQLERFLPENRDKIKTCTFMPFGLGPRACVGMRFALLEVKLALAKIIANYKISPGPNSLAYPPKFQRNPIFMLLQNSDFKLEPRQQDVTN